jgi:catechol 2,3-dioxygenase-like lactoylglutathione lyase family enzyme
MSYRGLHHVQLAIPPGGEDAAREFYGKVLGLVEIPKPTELAKRGGCWFRSPDGSVELHLGVEEDFRPARKAHPALVSDDLDALERTLRDGGIEVARDVELAGFRRFYVADPFGNRLEMLGRE